MAKTERLKILQAGDLWYAVQYTSLKGGVARERRAARHSISNRVRESINFRTSWQKLWLVMESTFRDRKDLYVTLTYRDGDLPRTREEADRRLGNFLRQLRKRRRESGQDLVYLRITEGYHSGGRLHHHLVINGTGKDYDLIRSLWEGNGDKIDIRPYRQKESQELAQYLTKEPREQGRRHVGDRTWRVSRNAKRPVVTYEDVPEGTALTAPPGAVVLDRDEKQNTYGRFQFLRYRLPEEGAKPEKSPW